jgi:hypothetical protein
LPAEDPADVRQARVVAGDEHLGAGLATCRALSEPIAIETSAFFMAKVPPKPQHSLRAGQLDEVDAPTARSSWSGRSPTRSIRSEWQVGW